MDDAVSIRLMGARTLFGLSVIALSASGCHSPARTIVPVVEKHHQERYPAMKSAPLIVLAEILDTKLASETREVPKPLNTGGPISPTIPLILVRMSARVLLTLRGKHSDRIEFYCWAWGGSMHGGPRLFHPQPGSAHFLFLREEGGYLHTAGDYPAYDLEISKGLLPAVISALSSQSGSRANVFERIASAQVMAEFGSDPNHRKPFSVRDVTGITSAFHVAGMLMSICRNGPDAAGHAAACREVADSFPGRCDLLVSLQKSNETPSTSDIGLELRWCKEYDEETLQNLRTRKWPLTLWDLGWAETAERRHLALRLLASGTDASFRTAVCQIIAQSADASHVPECTTSAASAGLHLAAASLAQQTGKTACLFRHPAQ